MGESSYREVWNVVKSLGGKMWAVYGEAVLYKRWQTMGVLDEHWIYC